MPNQITRRVVALVLLTVCAVLGANTAAPQALDAMANGRSAAIADRPSEVLALTESASGPATVWADLMDTAQAAASRLGSSLEPVEGREGNPVDPSAAATPEAVTSTRNAVELQALALVGYDAAQIGYTLSFEPHTGQFRGLTNTTERHIQIFVKPDNSVNELAYIIGHEIGHAVDHILNTDRDRAMWMQARGMSFETSWWPDHVRSDFATPAGDFAECFAQWRLGSTSNSSWGQCGTTALELMAQLAAR